MTRPADLHPTKIVAVHLSYPSRVAEYAAQTPPDPSYFLKPPSTLARHGDEIVRPRGCRYLNYEGEIAVIVGSRMKRVALDEALSYVAGYAPANDFGVHDFRHADRGSMLRVKGQDGFCPIGPDMADADEVDPANLAFRTYVNGEVVQEGNTGELLWSIAYMLTDLSRLITLEPGDILLSGTPANSRRRPAGRRGPPRFRSRGARCRPLRPRQRRPAGRGASWPTSPRGGCRPARA